MRCQWSARGLRYCKKKLSLSLYCKALMSSTSGKVNQRNLTGRRAGKMLPKALRKDSKVLSRRLRRATVGRCNLRKPCPMVQHLLRRMTKPTIYRDTVIQILRGLDLDFSVVIRRLARRAIRLGGRSLMAVLRP